MLKVRLGRVRRAAPGAPTAPVRGGRVLGEVEEYFAETLLPGDTFIFAGEVLRFEAIVETDGRRLAHRARHRSEDPVLRRRQVPALHLSSRSGCAACSPTRRLAADGGRRRRLAGDAARKSLLPRRDQMLVETFPRAGRHYLVAYPFEGRLAHQTLGMLLTRRLERARLRPLGFVCTDYGLAVWGLSDIGAAISPGGSTSEGCSRKTCSATTWRNGWRNRP